MNSTPKKQTDVRPFPPAGFYPHKLRMASLDACWSMQASHASAHGVTAVGANVVSGDFLARGGPNRLRRFDRIFAVLGGDVERIQWLEVVGLTPSGYRLKTLSAGPAFIADMDFNGAGVMDHQPLSLVGVDTGHRYAPTEHLEAVTNFKAFCRLGLETSLKAYEQSSVPATNQVFFNSHRHAIAALCLGQHFLAGGEIWVVIDVYSFGIEAYRVADEMSATFSLNGKCTTSEELVIEATIRSEGDYDHDGWMFEASTQSRGGYDSTPLFALNPNLSNDFVPGNIVLMTDGNGLSAQVWQILGVWNDDALLRSGIKMAAMNMHTGVASGAAAGNHFAALGYMNAWMHANPASTFKNILMQG